jgi:hypothetical protein
VSRPALWIAVVALAKVNEVAVTYAATGEEVLENIRTALDFGSVLNAVAVKVQSIIDAVVPASTIAIDLAATVARENPSTNYASAMSAAATEMGTQINIALSPDNLRPAPLEYADLSTILTDVSGAISALNTELSSAPAALQAVFTHTLASATLTVTSATASTSSAYDTINDSDPAQVVIHAGLASDNAAIAQARLQDTETALGNYQLTAPIDASARSALASLTSTVNEAETGAGCGAP